MGLRLLLGLLVLAQGLVTTARAVVPPPDPFCGLATAECATPYVLVVTAFPEETSAVLRRATVSGTVVVGAHTFFVGRLGGAPVVVVRAGIGMSNAAAATEAALARFAVGSIVFSGVAGSDENIADVVVPDDWSDGQGVYGVDADLSAAARSLDVALEDCTLVPPEAPAQEVCMAHVPRIVVGGHGESADPFGSSPLRCTVGGGPVFGCDDAIRPATVAQGGVAFLDAVDQETAAVARIATRAGVPFLGVRGVSDGGGDPLGLPGFPSQFFAYYVISAENAARVVEALLAAVTPAGVPEGLVPGVACNWARAATPACDGVTMPPGITRRVDAACGLLTQPLPSRAAARLRATWRRAARTVARTKKLPRDCRTALADALRARGGVGAAS